ncbi:MAG: integrase family protein, partial [Chthoniobacteraceae bacterium]|nr:integrase family protein [Chthoniobacteraceae bacterium]
MASVHKDPRGKSKYWYCAFTLPDGRRAFRSTKVTDRSEAVAIGERWERQARGVADAPKLQNKAFVMESFITLTQQAGQGEFTEATARRFVDDILKASGQAPLRNITIREFLMSWVESKVLAKAKGTGQRYRKVIESFINHLEARADSSLGAITCHDVQGFRDQELKAGKANKTANLAVKTLRMALSSARRQGLILTNAAEAVDHLPDNSAERGTFTADQIQKLLKAADVEWRGMILIAVTCGLRL